MVNMRYVWRIRVRFGGNSPVKEYWTKDIRHNNPGWGDDLFNQGIESLEFFLPTGHRIVFAGMEQYNFFVEAIQDFGGKSGIGIQAFWFMAKYPGLGIVESYRIEEGKVVCGRYEFGKEWGGGPTRGWKPGIVGTPFVGIVEGH